MRKFIFYLISFLLFSGVLFAQDRESEDFSYPLKLYKQEFYDLAAQQFIKFYTIYPQSDKVDDAKYYAGMALYKLREFDKARTEFQSLALEYPKSPFAPEAWFLVGNCAEKLNDFKEAARAYESLRILYPTDTRASLAVYKAGLIYFNHLQDLSKANQLFTAVIERYPSSTEYLPALVKKAKVSFLMGRSDEARKLLNKAFQIQSQNKKVLAEAHLIEGNINNRLGFLENAKKNYNATITLDPKSLFAGLAAINLGRIYIQESNWETAIRLLGLQLKTQTQDSIKNKLHYLLGDIYFLARKFKMAETQYKTIKTEDDSLLLVLQLKRSLCFQKQNYISEAIAILGKALENDSHKRQQIYNQVYTIYLNWLDQYRYFQQAASSIYQHLTQTKGFFDRAKLTNRLMSVLAKKGQWSEIISMAQPFLLSQERFPEKDDMLYTVALAKENMNEPKEAAYYYDKLIHEFNASEFMPEAKKHLKFLQDFRLVKQDVAIDHLADLFGDFLDANQNSKTLLSFKLGKIYFEDLKNYHKAEQQFQRTLEIDSSNQGDVHLYLGKSYLKLMEYRQYIGASAKNYLFLANEQFRKAVINSSTCSSPDESAWLLIKTSVNDDTTDLAKEKRLVEVLMQKYPHSKLKEKWLRSLALDMAFDSLYTQQSIAYFKTLIEQYPNSPQLPRYMLSLARLELHSNPDDAKQYLMRIINSYMFKNEAAFAMNDLLQIYEQEEKYNEVIKLFKKIQTYFYYTDLVKQNQKRMGDIYLKAGHYDQAITCLHANVNSIFLNDLILLKEFQQPTVYHDIFSLALAYKLKNEPKQAIKYYQLYLMLEPKGPFSDQAHYAIAELFLAGGQYFLAKENFKAVSSSNEGLYTNAVIHAGDIYFISGGCL